MYDLRGFQLAKLPAVLKIVVNDTGKWLDVCTLEIQDCFAISSKVDIKRYCLQACMHGLGMSAFMIRFDHGKGCFGWEVVKKTAVEPVPCGYLYVKVRALFLDVRSIQSACDYGTPASKSWFYTEIFPSCTALPEFEAVQEA